jgi:hypothetical protein
MTTAKKVLLDILTEPDNGCYPNRLETVIVAALREFGHSGIHGTDYRNRARQIVDRVGAAEKAEAEQIEAEKAKDFSTDEYLKGYGDGVRWATDQMKGKS